MSGIIGCIASVKRHKLIKRLTLVCASPGDTATGKKNGMEWK